MILGIGIDLLETPRMARAIGRSGERFVSRIFTPEEAAYCRRHSPPWQHFAARFAAKEAFLKALGTGWSRGISWQDVEVARDEQGSPRLRLSGRAARLARESGVETVHLSFTHEKSVVAAMVVLEGPGAS